MRVDVQTEPIGSTDTPVECPGKVGGNFKLELKYRPRVLQSRGPRESQPRGVGPPTLMHMHALAPISSWVLAHLVM